MQVNSVDRGLGWGVRISFKDVNNVSKYLCRQKFKLLVLTQSRAHFESLHLHLYTYLCTSIFIELLHSMTDHFRDIYIKRNYIILAFVSKLIKSTQIKKCSYNHSNSSCNSTSRLFKTCWCIQAKNCLNISKHMSKHHNFTKTKYSVSFI